MKHSDKFSCKIFFIFVISLIVMGCNEDLKTFVADDNPPVITDFSPKSGTYGTEIVILGENLLKIDSVWIGGQPAMLKYKIDSKQCIAVVTRNCVPGTIRIKGGNKEYETSERFAFQYLSPSITSYPATAQPNDEVLIEGLNLEAVTNVYFGSEKANIVSQDNKNLIVRVPYFEDSPVAISLEYYDGANTRKISTQEGIFTLIVPELTITDYPLSGTTNTVITLTGENLNLIEKVLFDEYEGLISQQTSTSMNVTIPEGFAATAFVSLKLIYLGVKELVLTNYFEVIVPDESTIYYWENKKTYCQDPSNSSNFFDANTGAIYSPCDYESIKYKITFFVSISGGAFQLNNPNNSENQTKNFKCNNANLPTEKMPNVVRFRTLNPSVEAQNYFIQQVKNKTLTEINQSMIAEAGIDDASTNGPKYREPSVAFASSTFTTGDVIMLQQYEGTTIVKVGFIEVVEVDVVAAPDANKSGWTFNCFFQKD